jgi:hypothetical protein
MTELACIMPRRKVYVRIAGSPITVVFVVAVTVFVLGARVASGQAPDPVVGAWKLNLARSKYVTPAPKSMTVTIVPAARGYTFTIESIGPDDRPQNFGYTSAFDGAETPVTGSPAIDTVIASSTGSGSTVRYKKAGIVITTTTSVLSDDGKTLVVTARIPDGKGNELTNVSVYERQ